MPANLPPAYFEAEKRYREAKTPGDGIVALEEMLAIMPKHKGTDKLKADLRRRISKLKSKQHEKRKVGKRESSFKVLREGVGQVVVIGAPNVGKSALVAALTNADPQVADFPHSTWRPTPGMMYFEDIQIQLIDTPPISGEYIEPLFFDMVRRSDAILVVVDVHTDPIHQLEETISILKERKIVPRRLERLYEDSAGWTFLPFLVIANKIDDRSSEENFEIFNSLLEDEWPVIPVSVAAGRNFDVLKEAIYHALEIIRIYTKVPGKEPDLTAPFVLRKGATLEELALKIHKDFSSKLKYARLWGAQVYDGQMVQRDHVLQDGDIVELHV
ncbi:MAG: 50S ribosome-binding GTPase [Deltaproteobacteria bacterium]|nr:50S ribosome-binding GTPase [Deltaproteobacteria bacterium]MBW2078645.1 50S ribosome-binding GTPase [Deltaproteobacteria bacterium]MBW2311396.1 50S ribosome-binding GTPase [Deltaproteobacteria bacterium]